MSYQVTLKPSNHQFSVEADETVLDAALRQGFNLNYGCRNGACGACMGKVLAGSVTYGDHPREALDAEDEAAGQALFCQAMPTSDLTIEAHEVGAVKDIPIKTLPCKVAALERLNHDVMRVKLKLPMTERMQFLAGQYVDFLLKDGRRRSFSIANPPHQDEFIELHVRHIEGGRFTSEVFDNMHEKDLVRIQGPLGGFFLREDSTRPIIFMVGGTGFGPVKGMIEHALAMKLERPMHLYWGARARADLYMDEQVKAWTRQNPLIRYTPVLSEPRAEDHWEGRTGYVHEAIAADYADLTPYEIYASGPPAMVYAGQDVFEKQGLDLQYYYSDAFEYAQD
ncbi:MAG: CDP-6-deoxy-delta-3,4-glucoseen reductase [Gammaproteobacteria bacterium]